MASHEGAWVGWEGGTKGMPPTLPGVDIQLLPIRLSAAQLRDYYHGFANATLWPLLHDAIEKPRFERAWWHSYQHVNSRLRRPGAGRARRAVRRARLGPRLPPDARSAADQGAAARSAGRILPARALAVAGHLRPPALAARRSCWGCSAPTWCPSTPSATAPTSSRRARRCLGPHRRPGQRLGDQAAGPAGGVHDERADLHRRGRVQPPGPRPGDRP